MSETVTILKQSSLDKLRREIPRNIKSYQSPNPNWEKFLSDENYTRSTSVELVGTNFSKCLGDNFDSNTITGDDPKHCEAIFRALENLTPQQATDERIWVYLTHFTFWDYTRTRWPIGTDSKKQKGKIISHFFSRGVRGIVRGNAISRLWWMGFACNRACDHLNVQLRTALDALLSKQDVRKEMMERGFFRSAPIFQSVMKFILLSYDGNEKLHDRDKFRQLTQELNRIGGMRVLDALEQTELDKLIENLIKEKLEIDPGFDTK